MVLVYQCPIILPCWPLTVPQIAGKLNWLDTENVSVRHFVAVATLSPVPTQKDLIKISRLEDKNPTNNH